MNHPHDPNPPKTYKHCGIECQIVADSVNKEDLNKPNSPRATTFRLKYHRFIHSEVMTHRVFSRNASSSRAVPLKRTIIDVLKDPAIPLYFHKNKKGMQGGDEFGIMMTFLLRILWRIGSWLAIGIALMFLALRVHKQIANRILEPFTYIHVVVTSTDYENFYVLRDSRHAQPEIKALAVIMQYAMDNNHPQPLSPGDYHLPFITSFEHEYVNDSGWWDVMKAVKVSVARCARASYINFYGGWNVNDDIRLYDRLVSLYHFSPLEHVLQSPSKEKPLTSCNGYSGNIKGFHQWRKVYKDAKDMKRPNT